MTDTTPHSPTAAFTLPGGGEGRIVKTDGLFVTVESPRPFPPGAPVMASIEGIACKFEFKVRTCKKTGEVFTIDGRSRNATRELLAHLKTFED